MMSSEDDSDSYAERSNMKISNRNNEKKRGTKVQVTQNNKLNQYIQYVQKLQSEATYYILPK